MSDSSFVIPQQDIRPQMPYNGRRRDAFGATSSKAVATWPPQLKTS